MGNFEPAVDLRAEKLIAGSRADTIMRVHLPVRQGNKVIALLILKLHQVEFYWDD
jgi:hypothetical protein